jgi:hypothetical protein
MHPGYGALLFFMLAGPAQAWAGDARCDTGDGKAVMFLGELPGRVLDLLGRDKNETRRAPQVCQRLYAFLHALSYAFLYAFLHTRLHRMYARNSIDIRSQRIRMKFAVHAVLGLSLAFAAPAFSAATAPAAQLAVPQPAHLKAVQDLLGAMQIEKVLNGVAARSRYASEAQKQAVLGKLGKVPPAEIYQRMAPALAPTISADTAIEMRRFYATPYGKQVIYKKYNSGAQLVMPGMTTSVPPEEKKERKRAAYVKASKALAQAESAIEHEAFKLLQMIHKEKR